MEPNGSLRVDEFLRVEDHGDVYAIGDVIAAGAASSSRLDEEKSALNARMHASCLRENLMAINKGETPKPYSPCKQLLLAGVCVRVSVCPCVHVLVMKWHSCRRRNCCA